MIPRDPDDIESPNRDEPGAGQSPALLFRLSIVVTGILALSYLLAGRRGCKT